VDKTLSINGCVFPRSMTENRRSWYRRFRKRDPCENHPSGSCSLEALAFRGSWAWD
jgi:hypothetical protein